MTKVISLKQGTPEWLDWRRNGITATEAAVILGVSKWSSPRKLYNEKLDPKPHEPSKYEEWGTRLEDVIKFDKFAKVHPEFDVRQGQCYEDDWRRCSLDGELYQDNKCVAILEIKTGRDMSAWTPVPEYYMAQVQWQMHVTGIHKVYFAVLINGCDYFERIVDYDPQYCEKLEWACSTFWHDNILGNVPPSTIIPDIDQLAMIDEAIAKTDKEPTVEVSEDLYTKYQIAKDAFDKADKAFKQIKAELTALFIDGTKLTYQGTAFGSLVTMKGRTTIDSKLLQEKYPDIYVEVSKTSRPVSYPKFG